MDVTMGPKAIKAFATAIQALSKIGKDLFIEADSEQVVLRALNDSKSAFSAVYLGAVSLYMGLLLPFTSVAEQRRAFSMCRRIFSMTLRVGGMTAHLSRASFFSGLSLAS
jgi:hypothetical protein